MPCPKSVRFACSKMQSGSTLHGVESASRPKVREAETGPEGHSVASRLVLTQLSGLIIPLPDGHLPKGFGSMRRINAGRIVPCLVLCLLLSRCGESKDDEAQSPGSRREIESRIIECPRHLDSEGTFAVFVQLKNNSDRSLVVPRYLSIFDMRITDRDGKEVPNIEDSVDIAFAPPDA